MAWSAGDAERDSASFYRWLRARMIDFTLTPRAHADVSLLRLAEGEWPLTDTHGVTEVSGARLEAVKVVRAGKVYACQPAVYRPHAH